LALLLVVSLIVVSASLAKERQARREAETASVKSQTSHEVPRASDGVGPSVALGRIHDFARIRSNSRRRQQGDTNQPAVEAGLRALSARSTAKLEYNQAEDDASLVLTINRN